MYGIISSRIRILNFVEQLQNGLRGCLIPLLITLKLLQLLSQITEFTINISLILRQPLRQPRYITTGLINILLQHPDLALPHLLVVIHCIQVLRVVQKVQMLWVLVSTSRLPPGTQAAHSETSDSFVFKYKGQLLFVVSGLLCHGDLVVGIRND